jgi:hypothetical protein
MIKFHKRTFMEVPIEAILSSGRFGHIGSIPESPARDESTWGAIGILVFSLAGPSGISGGGDMHLHSTSVMCHLQFVKQSCVSRFIIRRVQYLTA